METASLETKEAGCTVVWKIPNFKCGPFVCTSGGRCLTSAEFSSGGVGNDRWKMRCYPSTRKNTKGLFVELVNVTDNEQKASCTLELCLPDGAVKNLFRMKEHLFSGHGRFGNTDGVDTAAIDTIEVLVLRATVITKIPEDRDIPTLISDMSKLLTSGEFADFEIKAGSRTFKVHKILLAARCGYLSSLLKIHRWSMIMPYSEETTEELLSYLYSGKLTNHGVAEELILVAEKYCLPELKKLCSYSLGETLSITNVIHRISIAELMNIPILKELCLTFIVHHWKDVVNSPGFKSLITKHPSLAMEVIQLEANKERK